MTMREDGDRRKASPAVIVGVVTLILQFAGMVWGAATINAKVNAGAEQMQAVDRKIDNLVSDVIAVRVDVAALKSKVTK